MFTQLVLDLRPQDKVPSVENFQGKDVTELMALLRKAVENQIKALEKALEEAAFKSKDELALLDSLREKLAAIS